MGEYDISWNETSHYQRAESQPGRDGRSKSERQTNR